VEEDFSRVLELDSKYSDVYLYRSLFYQFYNKNTELEITNYNKLLELKPDYKFILYERALAYLSVGDTQKALKDLVNLSGSRIDDAVICSLRGTIYRNLGNYSYSIREFSKAIQMSEENAEYYFERGGVYAYLDDYESATSDYLKCMEKKPAWKDLYYHLGDSYYHIGDYDQAEMFFLKALKHGSNDFITYVGLSVLFYNKNEIVKMKRFMYHAMKLHRELESGMKGLEKLEKKGYYWSSRKKSDLYKVFEAMGIKEKEREDAKKTKRKHKTKPYPGKQQ
jgi:tetratricopeptide (TPR) repeat protein